MIKRPGFRFSLLTLLLIVTLAAVSISHWLAWQELEIQRIKVDGLRHQVRVRNDALGILTVDDQSQVHVIHTNTRYKHTADSQKDGPRGFSWDLYLPPHCDWELCWVFGEISIVDECPPNGDHNSIVLKTDASEKPDTLNIDFERELAGSWRITIKYGQRDWSIAVPAINVSWFDSASNCPAIVTGDNRWTGPLTESFDETHPIILLRQWNRESNPCRGVTVWLQPRTVD